MPSLPDSHIELRSDNTASHAGQVIAPADRGREANLVLLGCSILQLPIWGFAISYGVFQEYYTSSANLGGDLSNTGIIGNISNGIMYLSMPVLFGLYTRKFAQIRKYSAIAGALTTTSSLLLSSFATEVWHLVLTQGVLLALGSTLLYSSTTIYLDEWFIRRKGFAYGVTLAIKSVGGVCMPLFFGLLLSKIGLRYTLRIWAAITALTSFPPIFLLRTRYPVVRNEPQTNRRRNLSWSFLRHPTFYIFQLANIVFSSSYGMPQTYLASFASSNLNLSTSKASLILVALNAPSVLASFWFGLLADGAHIIRGRSLSIATISALSAIGACLPVFFFWGAAESSTSSGIALLAIFALTYGFFAGGYSATWGGIVKEIQKEGEANNEAVDTGLVFGFLNGGRGIGYVAGGFIGVELLEAGAIKHGLWAYGSQYGSVILFTGLAAAAGGISVAARQWKPINW